MVEPKNLAKLYVKEHELRYKAGWNLITDDIKVSVVFDSIVKDTITASKVDNTPIDAEYLYLVRKEVVSVVEGKCK